MKSITSRLNTFLAKIAGRDIDISTLTPPVAINVTEELLLEIAERVDDVSSVPEIEEGDVGKVLTASEDGAVWASGGGGGGLPDVSDASVGDLLTVAYGDELADIAIPAQDITFDDEGVATGFDTDWTAEEWQTKFVEGAMITAVINGTSYNGIVELDGTPYVEYVDEEEDVEISVGIVPDYGLCMFGPSGETFRIAGGFKEKVASFASRSSVVMVVENVEGNGTLSKTWQEIHDAMAAGVPVYVRTQVNSNDIYMAPVLSVSVSNGRYNVSIPDGGAYSANSPDDYPAYSVG